MHVHRHSLLVVLVSLALVVPAPATAYPRPGRTWRVSVNADGSDGSGVAAFAVVSRDGRTVAFLSDGALVPEDTNGIVDVYVRDLSSGTLDRVSVSSSGKQALTSSRTRTTPPSLSADGRVVAFESGSAELVAGDTNEVDDVFVHFRDTGETLRVSAGAAGTQAVAHSHTPAVSGDGRYVFFISEDDTLVSDDDSPYEDIFRRDLRTGTLELVTRDSGGRQSVFDPVALATNGDGTVVAWDARSPTYDTPDVNGIYSDVFARDLTTRVTSRISDAANGAQGDNHSYSPAVSDDGRYVAFGSLASNLVHDDRNGAGDVFVHDRATGRTTRVSVTSAGTESSRGGGSPDISAEGRFVGFNGTSADLDASTPDGNAGTDAYVHDLATGATFAVSTTNDGSTGNGISYNPRLSSDASGVSFTSAADDLVEGDTNTHNDAFVRAVGPPLGIGDIVSADDGTVSGWARFAGNVRSVSDPANDATVQARAGGGEIVGAAAAWRPEEDDLWLRVDLADLPHAPRAHTGLPAVRYTITFTVAGVDYQVRLEPVAGERVSPSLYRCAAECTLVGPLSGSLGATGAALTASVPAELFQSAPPDAAVTAIAARTSVVLPVGSTSGDTAALGNLSLALPRVELGVAPSGTRAEDVVFSGSTRVVEGWFFAHFGDATPGEPGHDRWARACLGELCEVPRLLPAS